MALKLIAHTVEGGRTLSRNLQIFRRGGKKEPIQHQTFGGGEGKKNLNAKSHRDA